MLPSQEYLREALDYDPASGVLTWRIRPLSHFEEARYHSAWNKRHAGRPAFAWNVKGALAGTIDNRRFRAHRVIWKWITGEEPPELLDHESRKPADNRWSNLRKATPTENQRNRGIQSNNKCGFKGVSRKRHRWRAVLGDKHLGMFDTPELASAAYEAAARARYGVFYPGEGR